jgi:hypothetical protein
MVTLYDIRALLWHIVINYKIRIYKIRICKIRICKIRICKIRIYKIRIYKIRIYKIRICHKMCGGPCFISCITNHITYIIQCLDTIDDEGLISVGGPLAVRRSMFQ